MEGCTGEHAERLVRERCRNSGEVAAVGSRGMGKGAEPRREEEDDRSRGKQMGGARTARWRTKLLMGWAVEKRRTELREEEVWRRGAHRAEADRGGAAPAMTALLVGMEGGRRRGEADQAEGGGPENEAEGGARRWSDPGRESRRRERELGAASCAVERREHGRRGYAVEVRLTGGQGRGGVTKLEDGLRAREEKPEEEVGAQLWLRRWTGEADGSRGEEAGLGGEQGAG